MVDPDEVSGPATQSKSALAFLVFTSVVLIILLVVTQFQLKQRSDLTRELETLITETRSSALLAAEAAEKASSDLASAIERAQQPNETGQAVRAALKNIDDIKIIICENPLFIGHENCNG